MLAQEIAGETGMRQFREDLVTEVSIEIRRLEGEGVEPDTGAAAPGGVAFARRDEIAPESLAAQALVDPEGGDVEPAAEGVAVEAAQDAAGGGRRQHPPRDWLWGPVSGR